MHCTGMIAIKDTDKEEVLILNRQKAAQYRRHPFLETNFIKSTAILTKLLVTEVINHDRSRIPNPNSRLWPFKALLISSTQIHKQ